MKTRKRYAAEYKFNSIALTAELGTSKDKRKLSEVWTKRHSRNVTGFWRKQS